MPKVSSRITEWATLEPHSADPASKAAGMTGWHPQAQLLMHLENLTPNFLFHLWNAQSLMVIWR